MAEKTEEPTPRRLREARRRGEVPRSADLGAGVGLLAGAAVLGWTAPALRDRLVALLRAAVDAAAAPSAGPDAALRVLAAGADGLAAASAPVLAVAAVAGAGAAFLQVGPLFAPGAVAPRAERLDPWKGAARLFDRHRLVTLVFALAKLAVVVGIAWAASRDVAAAAARATLVPPGEALAAAGALGGRLLVQGGVALTLLGGLDLLHERFRHRRQQRMTRDEVRREHKDQEGDPQHKQARQAAHRELVEHAVLEEVRRADVLVVNPTHFAVALRYDPDGEIDAPEVRARGRDDLARRMIAAAEEAGVPVLREVDLARDLYRLDVGEPVPERLFDAVAAVLQAAWRMRGEAPGGGEGP